MLDEATAIKGEVTSICKNIRGVFDATCLEFNKKSKSNRFHEKKKLEICELSQSLAGGSHYQYCFLASRSGASGSSSEILQLRQERDHFNVHGRNLETETPACQSAIRSLETQVANSSVERND